MKRKRNITQNNAGLYVKLEDLITTKVAKEHDTNSTTNNLAQLLSSTSLDY